MRLLMLAFTLLASLGLQGCATIYVTSLGKNQTVCNVTPVRAQVDGDRLVVWGPQQVLLGSYRSDGPLAWYEIQLSELPWGPLGTTDSSKVAVLEKVQQLEVEPFSPRDPSKQVAIELFAMRQLPKTSDAELLAQMYGEKKREGPFTAFINRGGSGLYLVRPDPDLPGQLQAVQTYRGCRADPNYKGKATAALLLVPAVAVDVVTSPIQVLLGLLTLGRFGLLR